ncbi:MAG: hypothetical protein HY541_06915 [Deltaproteobacteria bacterium]|nr:hypothetical protein [Deltaproteobacteria bacterium]
MVFLADMAFAMELIALGVGVFLLVRIGSDKEACCRGLAKTVSYVIIIGSILTMACTLYNAFTQYKQKPGTMKMMPGGMYHSGPMMRPGGIKKDTQEKPAETQKPAAE